MNFLLHDLSGVNVYLDDIIIYTDTWTEHLQHLTDVLEKLRVSHLTVYLAKTAFCSTLVTYLGQ